MGDASVVRISRWTARVRASIYYAMPIEGVRALRDFTEDFRRTA